MSETIVSIDKIAQQIEGSNYISRDLSWMQFNYRVLDQAKQIWLVGTDGTCLALTGSNTAIPGGAASVAPVLQADAWAPPQRRLYVLAAQTQVGADPILWMLGDMSLLTRPTV